MATQKQPAASANGRARNEGPIAMAYLTADNQDHRRVPDNVVGLKVTDKASNTSAVFDPRKLPEVMQTKLMFLGASRLVLGRISAGYDASEGDNAVANANEVWEDLEAGQLYAKVEGEWQRGRQVDATPYVNAMVRYFKALSDKGVIDRKTNKVVAPMTDKQQAQMKARIVSSSKSERTDYLNDKFKTSNTLLMKFLRDEREKLKKVTAPQKGEAIEVVEI